jgi:hypothetical protein
VSGWREHWDSTVLCLAFWLHVNRYDSAVYGFPQGILDPVANCVRGVHRHCAGHDEVEIDKDRPSGASRS